MSGLSAYLANAGFEDAAGGLRGWEKLCGQSRCAESYIERVDGRDGSSTHAAALRCSPDDWTSVRLKQRLNAPLPGGPVALDAWVRAGSDSWMSPSASLEARLELHFEDADEALGSCSVQRFELPAAWERMRVSCTPPVGSTSAWAVVTFACVRGQATLLADDVAFNVLEGEGGAPDSAGVPLADTPAAVAAAPIPRVVHVIFGLSSDFGGKPFGLVHHLVLKAALHFVRPSIAFFHHAHEPRGVWWERTKQLLALRRVQPPTSIFGQRVRKFAHQADVLRLEVLQQHGGVYLDLDVVLLRPLDDLLHSAHELVLAHEGVDGTIGAGNAMMLARPNASILGEWYQRYHTFSDAVWNGFSVRLPMEFAISRPDLVRTLDYTAFYWPPWNPWGVAQLYRTPRCLMSGQHAVHLWETKMWASLLSGLEPAHLDSNGSCFARLASAVHEGTFLFGTATVAEGQRMDENDHLIHSASLAAQLEVTPPLERRLASTPDALPPQLRPFLRKCEDALPDKCAAWAKAGECARNAEYMREQCAKACGFCSRA
jgi:hypothetical protein